MIALPSILILGLAAAGLPAPDALEAARNRQDRAFLERATHELKAAAEKNRSDAGAHYRFAQAQSYLAEVAFEQKDKKTAADAAETGIHAAERAIELQPNFAENHRLLGTLCGQIVPSSVLFAVKYGKCARSSIDRAIELDPRSSKAYVSRGVGNYYLPPSFGGGLELAVRDFRKAIQLDPRSADAHLWLGIALRKLNHHAEARKEIGKSLELNPGRIWAKQQFEKTPAK